MKNLKMPLLKLSIGESESATKTQCTPKESATYRKDFARMGPSGTEELRTLPQTARASAQTSDKKLLSTLQSA